MLLPQAVAIGQQVEGLLSPAEFKGAGKGRPHANSRGDIQQCEDSDENRH